MTALFRDNKARIFGGLVALTLISAPATAALETPAATQPPAAGTVLAAAKAEEPAKEAAGEKIVCRRVESTGSILGHVRVCRKVADKKKGSR
jgi:hypothetical protein